MNRRRVFPEPAPLVIHSVSVGSMVTNDATYCVQPCHRVTDSAWYSSTSPTMQHARTIPSYRLWMDPYWTIRRESDSSAMRLSLPDSTFGEKLHALLPLVVSFLGHASWLWPSPWSTRGWNSWPLLTARSAGLLWQASKVGECLYASQACIPWGGANHCQFSNCHGISVVSLPNRALLFLDLTSITLWIAD
jgi:hypothetical protein